MSWIFHHLLHWAGHWSAPVIAALLIIGLYFALVTWLPEVAIAQRGTFIVALIAVGLYAFGVYAARAEKGREDAAKLAERDAAIEVYKANEAKITKEAHDTQVKLDEAEKIKAQIDIRYVDRTTEIVKQPIVECAAAFGQMNAVAPKLAQDWRGAP